jgi:hypothetical protein
MYLQQKYLCLRKLNNILTLKILKKQQLNLIKYNQQVKITKHHLLSSLMNQSQIQPVRHPLPGFEFSL